MKQLSLLVWVPSGRQSLSQTQHILHGSTPGPSSYCPLGDATGQLPSKTTCFKNSFVPVAINFLHLKGLIMLPTQKKEKHWKKWWEKGEKRKRKSGQKTTRWRHACMFGKGLCILPNIASYRDRSVRNWRNLSSWTGPTSLAEVFLLRCNHTVSKLIFSKHSGLLFWHRQQSQNAVDTIFQAINSWQMYSVNERN